MPLPIDPPAIPGSATGLANIKGSAITPWFNSGQVKALFDLLDTYTADVLLPYIDNIPVATVDEEVIQDTVNSLLQAGPNIDLVYDDVGNTLTVSSTASGSGNSYFPGGW